MSSSTAIQRQAADSGQTLLLVEDDDVLRQVLTQALRGRGYRVMAARDLREAKRLSVRQPPDFAVIDLRLGNESGLELVDHLTQAYPRVRTIILTGYASIATAVEAIKLGAKHYLTKPADADEIIAALYRDEGNAGVGPPDRPYSVRRLEWEHIQQILQQCEGNISETARKLGMHRRTLQRKLRKYPVRQ